MDPRRIAQRRSFRRRAALAAFALASCGLVAPGAPVRADEPDPASARRIVSLNPSLTAIVLALGAEDRLVGVDAWSKKQNPTLAELPSVGGLYSPNLEALAVLAPDLVLFVPSAEQRDFHSRLGELGIGVEAFDPVRFAEVLDSIRRVGRITGREAAARARVAAIEAARVEVERAVAAHPRRSAVIVLQREPLFVAGGGNFIDEMLASAGARNLARSVEGSYPRISLEWLVAQGPEVIIDTSHDAEPAAEFWARWPSLPAVAAGKVVSIPSQAATLPGPGLDAALRLLARSVHGEDVLASSAVHPGRAR